MVVLDEDFGTNLTLVEGNGGVRLSPVSVPERAPRDWRSQCERERARADAAEARAEELRWAEVAARSDGGSWKSRFKACRRRLSEAVEETKEARRTARDVPSLQAEVARLETLLSEAGIASAFDTPGRCARRTPGCARPWRHRRRVPPRRRTVLEPSPDQKETVRSLRTELRRLDKEVVRRDKENVRLNTTVDQEKERTERIRETAKKLSSEVHREVRILGDAEARARSLSDEVFWLRHALEVSKVGGEVEGPARQAPGGRGDAVEAAVRRGCSTEAIAAPEDDDRGAAGCAQDRAGDAGKQVLAVFRAIRKALPNLPGFERSRCRSRCPLQTPISAGLCDRSRRQKATIKSLSRENARLRKGAKPAEPDRDAGSPAASCDRGGAVEGALRPQERAAGQAGLGTQARPAARRARPRPHPAARAR